MFCRNFVKDRQVTWLVSKLAPPSHSETSVKAFVLSVFGFMRLLVSRSYTRITLRLRSTAKGLHHPSHDHGAQWGPHLLIIVWLEIWVMLPLWICSILIVVLVAPKRFQNGGPCQFSWWQRNRGIAFSKKVKLLGTNFSDICFRSSTYLNMFGMVLTNIILTDSIVKI